jgi:hypothetical protein
LLLKDLPKQNNDRYASADELRKALDHAPSVSQPRGDGDGLVGKRRHSDRIDPSQSGPELQLKREDIDQYERGLKRRRWMGLLLLPLAAIGAAGAFVWMRHDRERPRDVEQEPNNTPAQANLIGNDRVVRGHIGKCLSPEESDRDFYRFKIEKAPYVLHVDLTGIPNMDLKMEVFDPSGKRIAEEDDLGPGESEDLPDVRLAEQGEYFIAVREVWVSGKPATENQTDWYTLNARFQPLRASQEAEPNDQASQAIPLQLGEPMRGFAGKANDVDYYAARGEGGGILSGSVSAIDGVDLKITVGNKVFDGGGHGAAESFDGVPWPAGAPAPLIIVERKDGKPDATGRWHGLVGLDAPYSLNVRLTAKR